jgi:anti-sigma-K factor RskA
MQEHHVFLAEYTLGLLDGQETSAAHALLGQDTEAVKTALNWENSLLELVDLLPPVHPSWQVLQRIQSDLGHQPAPAPSSLYRKPASDDTSTGAAPDADAATVPEAASTPARSYRTAKRDQTSKPNQAAQRSSHTEPYFSASPELPISPERPGSAELSGAGSAQASTVAPPSPASATVATKPFSTSTASPVAPAAPAAPAPPASPATPPSAAVTSESRPSSQAAEAAGSAVHIMGERDARRAERTAAEKTRNERQKTPASRDAPPKSAKAVTGNIWVWRSATLLFGLIALALAFIPSKPVEPPVTIVQVAPTQAAILQAPGQSSTPGWIVTIDAQRNVLLNPQVRTDIPSDAAVQLWTRSKTMPQPRSLGLIDPNQPVTVPAALMGEMSADQLFEMTQEPAGGSPTASPSGPVLFIGRLVTFGKPAPAAPQEDAASMKPAAGSR